MIITNMSALTLPAVYELEQECFAHPWSLDSLEESYNNPMAQFFVAKDDNGTVVGYISYYMVRDEGFINNVAVTASARRQGIGRALVERAVESASGNGASFLSLEVRLSNEPARNLYDSLGFELEGIRKKFYRDPVEDALILTRRLEQTPAACCADPDAGKVILL